MSMARRKSCWSDLPQDLMGLIFDRIEDPDIFRCHIACKSLLIASQTYFPLCLIQRDGEEEDSRTLFSISTKETREIGLPETKGQYIYSYSHGWLLTVDHASPHQLRLLSLISRTQIVLPPANTLRHHEPLGRVENFIKKTIVSTCPHSSTLVILIHYSPFSVAFCKPGDERWTCFNRVEYFLDIMLYKDQFYGVDFWGQILLFQLSPEAKEVDFKMFGRFPAYRYKYLVESVDGEFLMVSSNCKVGDSRDYLKPFSEGLLSFEVVRLDLRRKAWVELQVKDLRGQTLIICGGLCVSVPTGGSGRRANIFRGNCVVFSQMVQGNHCLMMHDLETAQTELLCQSSGKKLLSVHW